MTKVLIHQEDITILNVIAYNNRNSKYLKQKLAEFRPTIAGTSTLFSLVELVGQKSLKIEN